MADYIVSADGVLEPAQKLAVLDSADVVVAGGGAAGFAAAVAAARAGADVILLEERAYLGGVATGAMMTALVASNWAEGVAREVMDGMADLGGAPRWEGLARGTTPFDAEAFKQAALKLCLDAGVRVWLYTRACAPILEGSAVRGVVVESKLGRSAVLCKVVIDCTGDADLACQAGAPVYKGRESDNKMRPFALLFQLGGLDVEKIAAYALANPDEAQPQHPPGNRMKAGEETVIPRISGFYSLVEKAKRAGDLYEGIHYFRLETLWVERGTALCNTTRLYGMDGTDPVDLTRGEILGREQMKKLVAFARKYIPGCENAYVLGVSPAIGVRETRRILGAYHLSDEDAYADRHFEDSIMTLKVNIPPRDMLRELDVHMPEPIEGSDKDLLEKYPDRVPRDPHEYQVPYRVLVPKDVGGMLVAGKTISVSHMIDGHTRNMIPCMRFGQAAGAAAAVCARLGVQPDCAPFPAIKKALVEQGYREF